MDNRRSTDRISTILFDADGVVQRTQAGWQDELTGLLGTRAEAEGDAFLAAIQDAEPVTMDGKTDIAEVMSSVLRDFSITTQVDEVLDLWTRIEPETDVLDAVQELRRDGISCCLTTNQQTRRATWMQHNLGYQELFDDQFYSCDLGVAKPNPAYFTTILERLDVPARTVLFIDDTEVNITGARTVPGLHAELFARGGGRPALEEILARYSLATAHAA